MKCATCDKGFATYDGLYRHVEKKHPDELMFLEPLENVPPGTFVKARADGDGSDIFFKSGEHIDTRVAGEMTLIDIDIDESLICLEFAYKGRTRRAWVNNEDVELDESKRIEYLNRSDLQAESY